MKDLGVDAFLELVAAERAALAYKTYPIDTTDFEQDIVFETNEVPSVVIEDEEAYQNWKTTNVFKQKQDGLYAIGIKVHLGDFYTDKARLLADLIKKYGANE